MPVTSRGVSTRERPGSINPSKLSSRPTHSIPEFAAALATARITALSPGASPPPVSTPSRLISVIGVRVYQEDAWYNRSFTSGRLAQLGERRVRNAEVGSSSLLPSTTLFPTRLFPFG